MNADRCLLEVDSVVNVGKNLSVEDGVVVSMSGAVGLLILRAVRGPKDEIRGNSTEMDCSYVQMDCLAIMPSLKAKGGWHW